jgi:hypothetical protein
VPPPIANAAVTLLIGLIATLCLRAHGALMGATG